MVDILFEIGTEEIPARFMTKLLAELEKAFIQKFEAARLTYDSLNFYGTDRRLALIVKKMIAVQPDLQKEIKGPPANIAFEKGKLTKAGEGFCKKNNLDPAQVTIKNIGGAEYLYAELFEKGESLASLLPAIIKEVLSELHLPIAMRWGNNDLQFIRPVHWLVLLIDNKVVNLDFAGISATNKTRGHRFFSNFEIEIKNALVYLSTLVANKVFADQEFRKNMVKGQILQIEAEYGLNAQSTDELLNEVTYINECPEALVAQIDEKYLKVPQECLILTMQKNQKYFPLVDQKGKLTKYFIVISNNVNSGSWQNIIKGNVKVVTARLEDAKFFYEEDLKTKMDYWVANLKEVTYHAKIGTIYQKIERIVKNSLWLAEKLSFSTTEQALVKRAAYLCKADLASKMVYEFPELQGVMGRYYAKAAKEDKLVADAILDHWKPRFAGEDISKISKVAAVVAVADKIDSIVSCYSVGLIPSSSSDPYALRRAAQGIVSIIINKELDIDLTELVSFLVADKELQAEIEKMFYLRLKFILQELSIDYDIVNCVLAAQTKDIVGLVQFAQTLQKLKKNKKFNLLVDAGVRVARITAKVQEAIIDEDLFILPAEKELFRTYLETKSKIEKLHVQKKFKDLPQFLENLVGPITTYFDDVMINADDPAVKKNRNGQVKAVDSLFKIIGDFEKLVP